MKLFFRLALVFAFGLVSPLALDAAGKPTAAPTKKVAAHSPAASSSGTLTAKQIEQYARELKQRNAAAAYAKLSSFAQQKNSGSLGARAALALGYYDFDKTHYPQAAQWLSRAMADPLLRDYAVFYGAQTDIGLGHDAEAVIQLKQYRKDNPDSVLMDQAVQSLATAALATGQPGEALVALDSYAGTKSKPALLILRGDAHAAFSQPLQAAVDYQAAFLQFPTSDQAWKAGEKLEALRGTLGGKFPIISIDHQIEHANTIYGAHQWSNARNEYSKLLTEATGAEKERAELRILACGVALGGNPVSMIALSIADPDVDAERYYNLAQHDRNQQKESDMLAAIESAAARAPLSAWTESALFLGGNYFWVKLERDKAAAYYKRLVQSFPASSDANTADWRVVWASVVKRDAGAANLLSQHLYRFPGSPYTSDALYWLGRLAEEAENAPLARAYYAKLEERYPQNYFSILAAARMKKIGRGEIADAPVLATIPALPAVKNLGATIPAAAATRQARADALRSIGFDSSAELELRAAYAATGEPRLLLEAAQEAANAGHVGVAIVTIRQMYPQLESRPFADVPREVWLTSYALPYLQFIRQHASQAGVDPMLTAGLIRQESAFQADAHSNMNAYGLMQLEPKTARTLAKRAKVRYSTAALFDPDFNIRIGTIYLAGLRASYGTDESALAAYNAGETRVSQWTSGQAYREPAEFVDSIPFTETREYVELVTRNADIYRKLYGEQDASGKTTTKRGK
jgi:soluble lytic murein transglycosylase